MTQESNPDRVPQEVDNDVFARRLRAAIDGDDDAVSDVVESLRPYLLLIANEDFDRQLQGKLGPSDLVQSALFSARQQFSRFDGDSVAALKAWVRRILKNNMVDARRRYVGAAKRSAKAEVQLDSRFAGVISDPEDTPAMATYRQERIAMLLQAMDELPEKYRDVIRWRNWEKLGFAEMGERLGTGEDAARKLWARALVKLQKIIASRFPELDSLQIPGQDDDA